MSIALVIILVGLTSLAVAVLLLPLLLRRERPRSRDAHNLAVYRDQLAEVERDIGRGVLSAEQGAAARAEIGRRILALGPETGDIVVNPKRVAAATVAILLLPVAALLIYAQLGSPTSPDKPFAERNGDASGSDIRAALSQLRTHLKEHPDDLAGWLLLARSEIGLGHFPAGVEAYRHAVDLSGHRADIVGAWGEAQVMAAGGSVTPAAREAFETALKDPEAAPRSRYYLALAQMQQGDIKGALQAWRDLAAASPADASWLPLVRERIAEASAKLGAAPQDAPAAASPNAAMPSPDTVAAAMQANSGASPEQRRAMIDAMVGQLAARLAKQPDDADGWSLLGRSYMVLRQPDKARDAYTHAVKLKPGDTALKQALAEAANAAAGVPALPPAPPADAGTK